MKITDQSPAEIIINEVRNLGVDMTKEMGTHHFLYFPDCARAENAAAHLTERGFIADIGEPMPESDQWCVVASQELVLVGQQHGVDLRRNGANR